MEPLNILVNVDPTKKDFFLFEKLKWFANSNKINVHLHICEYQSFLAGSVFLHPGELEKAIEFHNRKNERTLTSIAKNHAHKNINYSTSADWHSPLYESILNAANKFNADYIFKDSHKHSFLTQMFFTPNDWQLLKSSSKPVIMTKNKPWSKQQMIIAAVDPNHPLSKKNHLDDTIIQHAKDLSHALQLPFKICHVFDRVKWMTMMSSTAMAGIMGQYVTVGDVENQDTLLKSIQEKHRSLLNELCSRHQLDNDQVLFIEDSIEDGLESCVKDNDAALLILGTTYRSGLLGSTAEHLVERIQCDLLAIKPNEEN